MTKENSFMAWKEKINKIFPICFFHVIFFLDFLEICLPKMRKIIFLVWIHYNGNGSVFLFDRNSGSNENELTTVIYLPFFISLLVQLDFIIFQFRKSKNFHSIYKSNKHILCKKIRGKLYFFGVTNNPFDSTLFFSHFIHLPNYIM